ncbi:hypothetical protein P8452_59068 [Trifolium repens]|nr:hypothetical protein P8452_59068 [Trifolium repens]
MARYNPKLQNPKLPYVAPLQECEYDDDCPQIISSPLIMRCIDYNCIVVNHQDNLSKAQERFSELRCLRARGETILNTNMNTESLKRL